MRMVSSLLIVCSIVTIASMGRGAAADFRYMEETAVAKAESLLQAYLSEAGFKRSEFGEPIVELANGDALIGYRLRSSSDESVIISLIADLEGQANIGDELNWQVLARLADMKISVGVEVFPNFS